MFLRMGPCYLLLNRGESHVRGTNMLRQANNQQWKTPIKITVVIDGHGNRFLFAKEMEWVASLHYAHIPAHRAYCLSVCISHVNVQLTDMWHTRLLHQLVLIDPFTRCAWTRFRSSRTTMQWTLVLPLKNEINDTYWQLKIKKICGPTKTHSFQSSHFEKVRTMDADDWTVHSIATWEGCRQWPVTCDTWKKLTTNTPRIICEHRTQKQSNKSDGLMLNKVTPNGIFQQSEVHKATSV